MASTTLTGILTDTATGIQYNVMTTTTPIVVVAPPPPPPVVVAPPPPPPVVVVPPPVIVESPDNTAVRNTTSSLIDASLVKWSITAGGKCLVGTLLDATTANVVGILLHTHKVYHWNATGNWYLRTVGQNPPWTFVATGDPRVVVVAATPGSGFTVSQATGFVDGSGKRWEFRGYNCWWGEYNNIRLALFTHFPGANFVRVVCDRNTTVANIQPMISELTGRNMVCLIDYHDSVFAGTIAWYQMMVTAFKANLLCFMETPNEPGGDVSGDQIKIINALRAAGWTSPIGLELIGGWQFDNVKPAMAALAQNNQIFLCPHNYASWWVGNMQNTANATGLYSIVDEFGDSTDGSNIDPNGADCVRTIAQSQMRHECGAAFWSATNGYHEGDNLFLDRQGITLSSMGKLIQQLGWLA